MKNKQNFIWNINLFIAALTAVFMVTTCDIDKMFSGENTRGSQYGNSNKIIVEPTEGKFTVTGLDNFNNCYVVAFGFNWNYEHIYAAEKVNNQFVFTGGKVSGNKVVLNIWKDDFNGTLIDYNDTGDFAFLVYVLNKSDFTKTEELTIGGYLYQGKKKPKWLEDVGLVYGNTPVGGICEANYVRKNPL